MFWFEILSVFIEREACVHKKWQLYNCLLSQCNGGAINPPCATNLPKVFGCAVCKIRFGWLNAICLGVLNFEADKSSRQFNERIECQIQPGMFHKIIDILGTPEIDLFACRPNNQLPKYVSWKPDPGASHMDAFSFSWSGKFVYIFPPFSLLNICLQKLEND